MKDIEYPAWVEITEVVDGVTHVVSFSVSIYVTAVYLPMYVDGRLANQGGGHNHRKILKSYLKDIANAKSRGATVKEGPMHSFNEQFAIAEGKVGVKRNESENHQPVHQAGV